MPFNYNTVDLQAILQRTWEIMDDLQRPGVGKARKNRRVLFNVWMGVGKTLMGLTSGLCFKPQTCLIIGSKNAINSWQGEIKKWFPEFGDDALFQNVRGQAWQRYRAWANPKALFFGVTSASFRNDYKWLLEHKCRFDVIWMDEIHKMGLRNRKSDFFKAIKEFVGTMSKYHEIKLINPMTGTWTSKSSPQQWAVLNLLAPQDTEFKSYWRFVGTYNYVVKGQFGHEVGAPRNTERLAMVTLPYVYTVDEATAKQSLPELRRIRLPAEMDDKLAKAYWSMAQHMFLETESGEIQTVAVILSAYMKLRQLVCCPAIVDEALGVGPCIEACIDKIKELEERPHYKHNIIFTPFVKALPLFKEYIAQELKIATSDILVAYQLETEELKKLEETFRRNKETIILGSLKSAQSWNAETAISVYFPHFEWDQDENKQAEARARRKDGVQEFICAYYATIPGTITEDMLNLLNSKEHLNQLTYQDFAAVKQRMQEGYQKFLLSS